jgi:hypothetical protein
VPSPPRPRTGQRDCRSKEPSEQERDREAEDDEAGRRHASATQCVAVCACSTVRPMSSGADAVGYRALPDRSDDRWRES